MTESQKEVFRRISRFLPLAAVVAVFGHGGASGQINTITGYNQVLGQWDASHAARTNNSRTGVGSPVSRDQCNRPGESYFQTDAAAGQNNWYCTVAGSPGTWVIGVGPVAVGASLPGTCAVGQQYFVTASGATYGLNICTATNTWTLSAASSSGTVTSVSAFCLPWLTCPVSTATTTPALAIGVANSQTSHQVIGTCGSATSFAPCSLVAGDLPSISLTTGVTGTLQAAQEPAHTGDMTNVAGSLATSVVGLNGTLLSGLSTGLLKITTGTGAPSIAGSTDILGTCTTCVTSASSLTSTALMTGAGSQASLTTTTKLNGGVFYPTTDSTTAIQFDKANGTSNVLTIDTTDGYVGIGTASPSNVFNVAGISRFGSTATSQNGTSGTAACTQPIVGSVKIATCYLNGYANTGTAQTYTYATAFSTTPVLLESGGSCGTYNPSTTASTLTLPANASMTAETCNIVALGQ